ncbi:MAG TPA: hypothetical protein VK644_14900 [Chitinophagaceae bacterium]|nr:hypothetical protein [Chitinophagaceae bacterium]
MLKLLTSLTFLYLFAIVLLLGYGWFYYKRFKRSASPRKSFALVFLLICTACIAFLWINIQAPLRLQTFSNLDHHFIRQDGFLVNQSIDLGRADTINTDNAAYNSFHFSRKNGAVTLQSEYSEEPFYLSGEKGYRIMSVNYPATGHSLSLVTEGRKIAVAVSGENSFRVTIGDSSYEKDMTLRKASTAWNVFRDDDAFINSDHYTNAGVTECLRNILFLRDDVSRQEGGELKFFLSARLFNYARQVSYDGKMISPADQRFSAAIPDGSSFAWGLGFLDNNRNQYRTEYRGKDSFLLLNKYPVAYPLTEEDRQDWSRHRVSKFLVGDPLAIQDVPLVFREGFMFSSLSDARTNSFSPVLLSYEKGAKNDPLDLVAHRIDRPARPIPMNDGKLLLPAVSGSFSWQFSVYNTYEWDFGSMLLSASSWQRLLFGSLLFYFVAVFLTALIRPSRKQSWVWQVLSCVTIILLTTRYFLYWRYKSFPPYEGMDLPSQQQLQSLSNFLIIVFSTIVLGIIFGAGAFRYLYQLLAKKRLQGNSISSNGSISADEKWNTLLTKNFSFISKVGKRVWFFGGWLFILLAAGSVAAINHFDAGVCRHLAIGLILAYFFFLFISYKYSPLVSSSERSWWHLATGKLLDIVINNPVKILLSVSLLALFVFIDIGFAIVFLNFLLFNEAFLCINYGIAGLSAGGRKNAGTFALLGAAYLVLFIFNLLYAPFVFKFFLELPPAAYIAGYFVFAIIIAYTITRLLARLSRAKRNMAGLVSAALLFAVCFFFFPKERILDKAAMTKYRIDVLATPVDKAIQAAYAEGKTYEPVIRAAQNQWFINTFIYEAHNPAVQSAGFNLLPHAPQNKGAKYNAQATDLVTSRFFIAEHGKWSVLLYVLILLLPVIMLASFYKLYPDFTNRVNSNYPSVTAGFSLLNYLLITALLVILAATGRYIFFGQDLPFGSILSKQSILFPSVILLATVFLFKRVPLEHYANRRKIVPGMTVFFLLAGLLFFVKPLFNKNKEFGIADLSKELDVYIRQDIQPVLDHFDTSKVTRHLPARMKDALFADSLRKMIASGFFSNTNKFFTSELIAYSRSGFARHLDQRRILYLDLNGGLQLSVNPNYFRVEAPPHLQQLWTGNVYGDTSVYHVSLWNTGDGLLIERELSEAAGKLEAPLTKGMTLSLYNNALHLLNLSVNAIDIKEGRTTYRLNAGDSLRMNNPMRITLVDISTGVESILVTEPGAFMRNFYVNGSRFYEYPMNSGFNWARNFAESISSEYTSAGSIHRNAFVSLDAEIMDSLSLRISHMMLRDTSYKKDAEYGICIADGNGRLIALSDFIKEMKRPDPNDKLAYNKAIEGENGWVSQSLLRKQIGNLNLLRMNPGPGSTLKPIVFSAIASQLNLDWDLFATEGFSEKQHFYGSEKVPEYDFEKNNGKIAKIEDYLKFSDNYYHSNVLLLGSYPKQAFASLLQKDFVNQKPGTGFHWPYFSYDGNTYWLDGFQHWPSYSNGESNFGSDSSFTSIGLLRNFGIYTRTTDKSFDMFGQRYDSLLFLDAYHKSGFILPEYGLFDQYGSTINHRNPYDLFTSCFRGHVKGSSQVLIAPAKMVEAYGKMVSQNEHYALTLDPYAQGKDFSPFYVDEAISYNHYLDVMRENVFAGMREALFNGTAGRLGSMLENGSPYYYYGKTGTTGDDELKSKSKLFVVVISLKDISQPDFNFRKNRFYTIYFTSQAGPAKQNEEFQAEIIRYIEETSAFKKYMKE